jgi:hypothetical protein
LDRSRTRSPPERCSLPESSTGDAGLKVPLLSSLLLLLAGHVYGQQDSSSQLQSLVDAAQHAQSVGDYEGRGRVARVNDRK